MEENLGWREFSATEVYSKIESIKSTAKDDLRKHLCNQILGGLAGLIALDRGDITTRQNYVKEVKESKNKLLKEWNNKCFVCRKEKEPEELIRILVKHAENRKDREYVLCCNKHVKIFKKVLSEKIPDYKDRTLKRVEEVLIEVQTRLINSGNL